MDSNGYSGGLWAACDKYQNIRVVKRCDRFLALIIAKDQREEWMLLLFYGHPKVATRLETWEMISWKGRVRRMVGFRG